MTQQSYEHDWRTHPDEPAWESIDPAALPAEAFAFVGKPGKRSTWNYPHHWLHEGTLYTHREGLEKAWQEAAGNDAKAAAAQSVIDHLTQHREKLGMTEEKTEPEEPEQAGEAAQEAEESEEAEAFAELADVEVFRTGTYRGRAFGEDDLDSIVENWRRFDARGLHPPLVLGHGEGQDLLENSGLPAAGWLSDLKHVGGRLVARFREVPQLVARLIRSKGYRKRSIELYTDYMGQGLTLRRIALLGAEVPELKNLADVARLYLQEADAEHSFISVLCDNPASATSMPDMAVPKGSDAQSPEREESTEKYIEALLGKKDRQLAELKKKLYCFEEAQRSRARADLRKRAGRRALSLCERFGVGTAILDDLAGLLAQDGVVRFGEAEVDRGELAWRVLTYMADDRNRVTVAELSAGEEGATAGDKSRPHSLQPVRARTAGDNLPRSREGEEKTAWCLAYMSRHPDASFAEAFRRGAASAWRAT